LDVGDSPIKIKLFEAEDVLKIVADLCESLQVLQLAGIMIKGDRLLLLVFLTLLRFLHFKFG
jgi:hypothetical protein